MAAVSRSVAALRIFGDNLVPEDVSALLKSSPTKCHRKGDIERTKSGREIVRKTGMWLLNAKDREPEALDSQVAELLAGLTTDEGVWTRLSSEYAVDLFCGLFMNESNEGFSLSTSTLALLSARGIEIGFDIYTPTRAISPDEPCPCKSGKPYADCCAVKQSA